MVYPSLFQRRFQSLLLAVVVVACSQAQTPTPSPTSVTGPSPTTPALSTAAPSGGPAQGTGRPTSATLAFVGGTILTMDPEQPEVAALAVREERILAVGEEDEVLAQAGPEAVVVDLGGRTMLPGFNDAHAHRLGDRDVAGIATAEEAITETLAHGFTSMSELFVNQERLDELVTLDETGDLRLRVNAYLPVNYHDQKFGIWFDHLQPHQQMSPRVRIGGVKAFADWVDPERMLLSEDHPLHPGYRGELNWAPNEMAELVEQLHRAGWQVAIHAAGDGGHDMVLDAYERALAGGPNDARHRIEHLVMLRDDQIERIATMDIVASFQLGWFTTLSTDDWENALPGLTDRLGRWRDLLDAGVPAVGSTDTPWAPPVGPAMLGVGQAVTRIAEGGAELADWQERQRITVDEALSLLTVRGAWATFEEDEKGTLEAGKLADLVILSDDPRSVPPETLADVSVLATIIGGRVEYCAPGADALCPAGKAAP